MPNQSYSSDFLHPDKTHLVCKAKLRLIAKSYMERRKTVPELLTHGRTPEEWSQTLAGHGVHVSPRLIRSKARETGNYRQLGHLMLLLPSHIEALIEPGIAKENLNRPLGG
ncbi:hypothetical protein So717_26190 [Roseobacter cerasinus]|uniref:Uncharacterized protein n=1 Tax=Roseobacter cerasinus TaxID=2602289 RepID=A0A640VXB7_9RHOB|nr:hypothetical protein [Roseobacter cerasinus]GFE50866.1 hypothetical protein So717_26190 [Roseobacter cerasinus]